MVRVVPSPYLLGVPIRPSMGLGGLRMETLSPILREEVGTEGLETANGFRGSSFMTGLEGSDVKETTGAPPGLELLPLGAERPPPPEPEISIFFSPL